MHINLLDRADISYIDDILLNSDGTLKIVSWEQLKDIPQSHICQFCVKEGVYCIPTTELIEFLNNEINDERENTIEIGAGNGVLGLALGITCTDNFMQNNAEVKALYQTLLQATVKYGKHVKPYDAIEAVKRYSPKIVIGAWVTHKYNPKEHWREGNLVGVPEEKILKAVKKYIFIGNEKVHDKKPILCQPHRTVKADWLVSRSMSLEQNVIWIWD